MEQRRHKLITKSSRVNQRIAEYYTKFGNERDLEKFMRFSSDETNSYNSSQDENDHLMSKTTTKKVRYPSPTRLREIVRTVREAAYQSMPNLGLNFRETTTIMEEPSTSKTTQIVDQPAETLNATNAAIQTIPIRIEEKIPFSMDLPQSSTSAEDLRTPIKLHHKMQTKETQTPESVVKSHKRLEWDSLADIGYKKSRSTSNISILERSLLREYFHDRITSQLEPEKAASNKHTPSSTSTNTSDENVNEVKVLRKEVEKIKGQLDKVSYIQQPQNTPPLASSTLVELPSNSTPAGARPKVRSQGTSMSLHEFFEHSVQTTLPYPVAATISQEVQVNIASGTSASALGSTVTPSSFESYSTRSSFRNPSIDDDAEYHKRKHLKNMPKRVPLTANVKKSSSEPETDQLQLELEDSIRHALFESKDDISKHSSTQRSPQLDLGIQLLCSLIEAKSLSRKEKKKLIRNIIKRIISDEDAENTTPIEDSENTTPVEVSSDNRHVRGTTDKNATAGKKILKKKVDPIVPSPIGSTSQSDIGTLLPVIDRQHRHQPQTSEAIQQTNDDKETIVRQKSGAKHIVEIAKQNIDTESITDNNQRNVVTPSDSVRDTSNSHKSQHAATQAVASGKSHKRNFHIKVSQEPTKLNEQAMPAQLPQTATKMQKTNINLALNRNCKRKDLGKGKAVRDTVDISNKKQKSHCTDTTSYKDTTSGKSRTSYSNTPTSSLTSSIELVTQKPVNVEIKSKNSNDNESVVLEWLNPMTQSEIDYEEKKRKAKSTKRDSSKQSKTKRTTTTTTTAIQTAVEIDDMEEQSYNERNAQLNWIQAEIQRLESLRHLLLKDNENGSSDETTNACVDIQDIVQNSLLYEKLYDTVCTSQSSILSENAERIANDIDSIIDSRSVQNIVSSEEAAFNEQQQQQQEDKHDKQQQYNCKTDMRNANETTANALYDKPSTEISNQSEEPSMTDVNMSPADMQNGCITMRSEKVITITKTTDPKYQRKQRSKIDTPASSNDSESVCSFVEQRTRNFVEKYTIKRTNHYKHLVERQQQQLRYLQKQLSIRQFKQSQTAYIGQHSLHHTHPPLQYYCQYNYAAHSNNAATATQQQHIRCCSGRAPPPPPPAPAQCQPCRQCQCENLMRESTSETQTNFVAAAAVGNIEPVSSESTASCTSSDVSVPMGSNDNHSSSTTTHQYDDVAKAAATVYASGMLTEKTNGTSCATVLKVRPIISTTTMATSESNIGVLNSVESRCLQVRPKGIAYCISFKEENKRKAISRQKSGSANTSQSSNSSVISDSSSGVNIQMTLKECLERAKPSFCQKTKERKAILNQLQAMRQEREREMRRMIEDNSFNSLDSKLNKLPPPPTTRLRILRTKEMKALTSRRCAALPEVLHKQKMDAEERTRRNNRILRDIFNQRLRRRVQNGKISLNHSRTII